MDGYRPVADFSGRLLLPGLLCLLNVCVDSKLGVGLQRRFGKLRPTGMSSDY